MPSAAATSEPAGTRLSTLVGLFCTQVTGNIQTVPLTLPAPNDQADNLITTNDVKFHARVRTLLSNSFTEDSIRHCWRLGDHGDYFDWHLQSPVQEQRNSGTIMHRNSDKVQRVVPEGGDTYAGVFLPGGTRLRVHTFTINRSGKLFSNPDSFVPERWLPQGKRPAEYDNDHLSASKPFSIGFHSCLGQSLAWVELRLVLTRLLWAFDFVEEPAERVDFDAFPVIMIIQKEPMKMRINVRPGVKYKTSPNDGNL